MVESGEERLDCIFRRLKLQPTKSTDLLGFFSFRPSL
jgi:hypothetical protein